MVREHVPENYKGIYITTPGTHIEKAFGSIHQAQRIERDKEAYQRIFDFKRNNRLIHQRLEELGITEGYGLDLTDESGNEHAITGILGKYNMANSFYTVKNSTIATIGPRRLASLTQVDISDIVQNLQSK